MSSVHLHFELLWSLPFNEYRKPGAETLTSRIFSLTGRILLQCSPMKCSAKDAATGSVSVQLRFRQLHGGQSSKRTVVNSHGRKPVEEERKKTVRPEWADETFPRMRTAFFVNTRLFERTFGATVRNAHPFHQLPLVAIHERPPWGLVQPRRGTCNVALGCGTSGSPGPGEL